jgi:peptidoglycan/LPS O-acetylase OafA/YrhL
VFWLGHRSRRLPALVLASAALSGFGGWWLYKSSSGREGGRVYFGTDTRADALLLGAAVAIWLVSGRRLRIPLTLFFVGIGLLAISVYSASPELARVPISATIGAAIVIGGILDRPRVSALLSWRPLRWTGRISYGLYLWHYPLFALMLPALAMESRGVRLLAASAAAYAAAAASYYLVEPHFLRLNSRVSSARDFPPPLPEPPAQLE